MEDLEVMLKIFVVVLLWGGLLLFAGFGLEMLARVFRRGGRSAGIPSEPAGMADTSGTTASS